MIIIPVIILVLSLAYYQHRINGKHTKIIENQNTANNTFHSIHIALIDRVRMHSNILEYMRIKDKIHIAEKMLLDAEHNEQFEECVKIKTEIIYMETQVEELAKHIEQADC